MGSIKPFDLDGRRIDIIIEKKPFYTVSVISYARALPIGFHRTIIL